ncbi:hypothetical protein CHS0354_001327 [Potamilus streckersoni]|uniref:14 kDa phosphohistidine phosphatase n=1 Tax=Potamilus streckersoni TaxID=2493646 RepID=A0AAE0RVQ5_9BIVA|nr:hypothetical protein CHS0354_001327 [Potamilus streckersoni]
MAVAAITIASPGAKDNPKLKAVSDVDIEKSGKFKYILIKVHDPDKEREFKHIVRGYADCGFHAEIYDKIVPEIETNGLDCECLGGGRILHEPAKRTIQVYGYSQAYGQADHKITASILQRKFKDYEHITWSNEGY